MRRVALFLDDGGVINDNSVRGPQWQRLVGEYFPPLLGGQPEAWARANRELVTGFLQPGAWSRRIAASPDYESFERTYFVDWLGSMCDMVGVPRLPDEEAIGLARRTTEWVIPQVHSEFPGVAETIRLLKGRGHMLYTASGASSSDLGLYLNGTGVRDCFERLYGPDLVETFKIGPEFYERLLEDARVDAEDAIVVDDSEKALGWAGQVGLRGVLVGSRPNGGHGYLLGSVAGLTELPGLLEALE